MFNLAELWGLRPDGTNPCRHIQKYTGSKRTRLITDEELTRLYAYLDHADAEGLEHPLLTFAIRLQFEFAARMSEVLVLEWEWIDFANRRVVWPDSKTGGMSKPLSAEAALLLRDGSPLRGLQVRHPALFDGSKPMSKHTYWAGWRRILERAGCRIAGPTRVRHRAATDIANSGVPVKVGMALTAHKTVTMFMRYVHTEDDPVRAAAEAVNQRRQALVGGGATTAHFAPVPAPEAAIEPPSVAPAADVAPVLTPAGKALGYEDGQYTSRTKLGNYRPFRHRSGEN